MKIQCTNKKTGETWFAYDGADFTQDKAAAEAKGIEAQWPEVEAKAIEPDNGNIADKLIDRAERIFARPNGTRGFESVTAGEILAGLILKRTEFTDACHFQGLPEAKAPAWHALCKQAAHFAAGRGWVRFYAADGTLLPVNQIP